MGAVIGAHVLLNEVIKAKMSPPKRPIINARTGEAHVAGLHERVPRPRRGGHGAEQQNAGLVDGAAQRHARRGVDEAAAVLATLEVAEGVLAEGGIRCLHQCHCNHSVVACLGTLPQIQDSLAASFILFDGEKPGESFRCAGCRLNRAPARRIRFHAGQRWPSGSRWWRRAESRRARPWPCSSWLRQRRRNQVGGRAANRAAGRR